MDTWDMMRDYLLLMASIDRGVRANRTGIGCGRLFLRRLRHAAGLVAVGEGHKAEGDHWDHAVSFFDAMVACERGEAIDDTGVGVRRIFANAFERASGIRLATDGR